MSLIQAPVSTTVLSASLSDVLEPTWKWDFGAFVFLWLSCFTQWTPNSNFWHDMLHKTQMTSLLPQNSQSHERTSPATSVVLVIWKGETYGRKGTIGLTVGWPSTTMWCGNNRSRNMKQLVMLHLLSGAYLVSSLLFNPRCQPLNSHLK